MQSPSVGTGGFQLIVLGTETDELLGEVVALLEGDGEELRESGVTVQLDASQPRAIRYALIALTRVLVVLMRAATSVRSVMDTDVLRGAR